MGTLIRVKNLRRLLRLVRSDARSLARLVAVGGLIQGLSLLGPYCEQSLIDRVYPLRDVNLMNMFVGAAVATATASLLMKATRPYVNSLITSGMHMKVSVAFFDHIQHLPITFFDEHRSGEIASRFQDIRASLRVVILFLQTVATNSVFLVLIPPVLFFKNSQLALIAVLSIPVTTYLTYRQSVTSYRNAKKNAELTAEVQAFQTEAFSNIRWLKALGLEDYCRRRYNSMLGDLARLQRRIARTTKFYTTANGLARAATWGACVWLGWRSVIGGGMTLGQYVAFMTYLAFLHNPIAEMVSVFSSIQETMVTFERVNDCLEQPREGRTWQRRPAGRPGRAPSKGGDIEFDDVSFGYQGSGRVLRHVSISFRMGTVNAIVGPSGSGKTTILRLLVGFYKPSAGAIRMGGSDTSELMLKDLRSRISVVWQDASLLSGSLWENLTLGASGVTKARVEEVVEMCQLGPFVASLARGYETQIGEGGVLLSAGQRQRVAIAQALLRDTPVILFDEATANIDTETEARLLDRVLSEFRDRLIIFISHRPATASLADRVFVCEAGEVREAAKESLPAFGGDGRTAPVGPPSIELPSTVA